MDYLVKALLTSESCSDLYDLLSTEDVLTEIIKVCRSTGCRDVIEFFLQKDGEGLVDAVDSYLKLAPLALIISISFGNPYMGRFAHRFSKLYIDHYLTSLSEVEFLEIARSVGLEVEKSDGCFNEVDLYINRNNATVRMCYRFRMPFTSYLKAVQSLSSTEFAWSLLAVPLYKGFALIENREKVERILLEYLRNSIIGKMKSIHTMCSSPGSLYLSYIDRLSYIDQDLANDIKDFVKILNPEPVNGAGQALDFSGAPPNAGDLGNVELSGVLNSTKNLLVFAENLFPPCIQAILRSLVNGENLTHHQRFALATFLLNLNTSVDDLLKIFKYSPDFNERIARYQLEHLAGLRGSKRRYLPYSCSTMKTLNMCNSECGTRNPLQYVYRRFKLKT